MTLPTTAEDDALAAAGERALRLAAAERRAQAAAASRGTMDNWRQQRSCSTSIGAEGPAPAVPVQPQQQLPTPVLSAEVTSTPQILQIRPPPQPPQMPAAAFAPEDQYPFGVVVGSVVPLPRPPVDFIDGRDATRCPKAVAFVLCCLSGLLFTVAAVIVVKHNGHVHMPKHFPGLSLHHGMHLGPWKLPILLLFATMLCSVAAVMRFCRKGPQRRQTAEDVQCPRRPKYLKGAALACLVLGTLLVTIAAVVSTRGHRFRHPVHILHSGHGHHTLHLVSIVFLPVGVLSIAASIILYTKAKTSARDQAREGRDPNRSSSRQRGALIVLAIVLGLLLIKGALLAARGRLHLPTHLPSSMAHHRGHHGHHGPREWQANAAPDTEEWAEEKKWSEWKEGGNKRYEHGPEVEGTAERKARAFLLRKIAADSVHKETMVSDRRGGVMASMWGRIADKMQHVIE